jgi:hypothetical protein
MIRRNMPDSQELKDMRLIKLHYYWPTLNRDVEDYAKRCDSCAGFNKVGRNPNCTILDGVD